MNESSTKGSTFKGIGPNAPKVHSPVIFSKLVFRCLLLGLLLLPISCGQTPLDVLSGLREVEDIGTRIERGDPQAITNLILAARQERLAVNAIAVLGQRRTVRQVTPNQITNLVIPLLRSSLESSSPSLRRQAAIAGKNYVPWCSVLVPSLTNLVTADFERYNAAPFALDTFELLGTNAVSALPVLQAELVKASADAGPNEGFVGWKARLARALAAVGQNSPHVTNTFHALLEGRDLYTELVAVEFLSQQMPTSSDVSGAIIRLLQSDDDYLVMQTLKILTAKTNAISPEIVAELTKLSHTSNPRIRKSAEALRLKLAQ
ncbi:MAG TPA: hypothetical protein VEH27_15650 [Methylomirabilota bacterium]|nr:hypothetical protein [Methylomirabilota bacterium]